MANRNLFQAFAIFILESVGEHLWGFRPNLMAALVTQKGALRSLIWFAKNMPPYQRILEKWGPIRTHLLATEISVLNGCAYSVYGHAQALELHYLQTQDRLFPLSESEMMMLIGHADEEILDCFELALAAADLAGETFYIKRVAELYQQDTVALTQSDRDCLHLIHMFSVLNACLNACLNASSAIGRVELDMAHDAISKDRALRDRYAALRRTQLAASTVAEVPFADDAPVILNPADLYEYEY